MKNIATIKISYPFEANNWYILYKLGFKGY